jgi:peptide/nickel transport system permease protein
MNKRILEMIGGRLAVAVLSLFLVSLAVFFITELLPGDTAQELLGQAVTTIVRPSCVISSGSLGC